MPIGNVLRTGLDNNELFFGKLIAKEALGEPFRFEFHLLSESSDIDFHKLLGEKLSLEVDFPDSIKRYFSGIVTKMSYAGAVDQYSHYVAIVRPSLWWLKHSADCRIFQEKSVLDVIMDVLQHHGINVENQTQMTTPTLDYCVQYRETDFDFVSRLMEQVGIYYYFNHSTTGDQIVLVDSLSVHQEIVGESSVPFHRVGVAARQFEHLWMYEPCREISSVSVATSDYDYENPSADLLSRSTQEFDYESYSHGDVYDYPGLHRTAEQGELYTQFQIEARQVSNHTGMGQGNAIGLTTGYKFKLTGHPRANVNIEYLIIESETYLESFDFSNLNSNDSQEDTPSRFFHTRVKTIPADVQFRNQRRLSRPKVGGPQTAVVVGSQEDPEIWTDDYGRIKVQFHWDRDQEREAGPSCWVRVAQMWAGAGRGALFIPRAGDEVVVHFLEGDPDQPLVVGSVYNATNQSPFSLPEDKNISGIVSRTTADGTNENANQLSFNDTAEQEEFLLHAERDFTRVVENNDVLEVGLEKGPDGSEGSQTITIYGDRNATIQEGDDLLEVTKGDSQINVKAGSYTIEAANSIKLVVGGSTLELTPSGISLSGTEISISGDAAVDVSSPSTKVAGDGSLKMSGGVAELSGGLVKIN